MFGKCGTLSMDPSFPTEDLAGGLWTSRNGMGRTDSEAAFQEFLKKIPSSTNLAGQGHASEQQGSNLASIPQQMAPGIAQHTRLPIQPIGAPEAKPQPATSRVQALGAHDVVEISVPEASGMPAPAFATTAGLTPLPGQADYAGQLQHINPLLNPLHAAQATAAAAGNPLVAAGMNYAELAALGTLALGQGNPYDLEKAKERRQRRMASNRESARRSRKRKQEHLNELEEQLQDADRERKEWMKKTEDLEARVKEIGDQNARLQEENDGLKRHLATLQGPSGATSDAGR